MRYSYATLLFAVAFLLQPTLLNLFSVFGTTPDLILCLVIALSFLYEQHYYGIILGGIFGLLSDICFMQYVGVAGLGYFLVGTAVILIREVLNKENIASILIVGAGATFVYNLYYWAVMWLMGSNYSILHCLQSQPVAIIYNLVVITILYKAMIKKVIKYHYDRYYR